MAVQRKFRVAVIGAGPVGLATAAALRSAGDHVEVVLFDRARGSDPAGATAAGCTDGAASVPPSGPVDARALEIWPNAVAALRQIPVPKGDRATAPPHLGAMFEAQKPPPSFYRLERYDFRSPTGRLLWGAPTGSIGRRLGRHPHVLSPQQLLDGLSSMLDGSGIVPRSETVERVDLVDGHTKVDVKFASGGVERFDLVVAADGAASTVRRRSFAREPAPKEAQCDTDVASTAARRPSTPKREAKDSALFESPNPRPSRVVAVVGRTKQQPEFGVTSRGIGFVSHLQDARFGAWACPEEPEGHVRWLALVPATDLFAPECRDVEDMRRSFDDLDRPRLDASGLLSAWVASHREEVLARLRRRLQALNLASLRLLDVVDAERGLELDSLRVFVLSDEAPTRDDWFSSRVVLLGDAVHPTLPDLGQGCGLAFEDAEALGRHLRSCLSAAKDVLPTNRALKATLEEWRDERHGRAAFVVQMTRVLAEAVHLGREPQGVRDAMVSAFGPQTVLPSLYAIVAYEPPTT